MFKRFISILLIFTVNILFLTHAVVPHHHHNGIPHFTSLEIENHAQHEEHCCCPLDDNDEHQHSNEGSCQLEQDINAIRVTGKEDCHCLVCCCNLHNHSDLLLQATLLYFNPDFSFWEIDEKRQQPPYLINYHSIYASSALGLRAPPSC